MPVVHHLGRSLLFALACSFVVVVASACFQPDVEALTAKMREECRLGPAAPNCAQSNPEASDYAYERYFSERVDSQAEQDCALALECDPETQDVAIVSAAFGDCLAQELDLLEPFDHDPELECGVACDGQLFACGGEEACGVDVVEQCFADNDACRAACPAQ